VEREVPGTRPTKKWHKGAPFCSAPVFQDTNSSAIPDGTHASFVVLRR